MWTLLARSALVLAVLLVPVPGRTAEPLTPANTALSNATIERRTDFIEQRLDERETHGQIWYWSWMAIGRQHSGLAVTDDWRALRYR